MEDEVDEDGGRQADDGHAQHDVVEPEPARRWLCALACFHLSKKKHLYHTFTIFLMTFCWIQLILTNHSASNSFESYLLY